MTDAERTGRVVGVMLLLQIVGLMVGFILITEPLRVTDYLTTVAGNAMRIKVGLLVLLANCALTIGISITAWRALREYSQQMTVWLIVLSVIMLVMQAVDGVHIMSMISLSQQNADGVAGVTDALAASVRAMRRWAHFLELWAIDAWLMMLYGILLRFTLVPRVLSLIALLLVVVHFVAIPLPGFLGYGIYGNLGIPMAVGMLAVAGWLMMRGFNEGSFD